MWYKVNELFSAGLNKTPIGQSLGLHRQTVSKYLSMTEEEFMSSQSYERHYGHKLDAYETYVVNELRKWPFLSAPQLHDRLKEHFSDLPSVSPKTVFNFVNTLHEKASLIITTNKAPTEWAKTLDDEVLAFAILDQLLYHCEVIKLSGQSYRMGNRKSIFEVVQDPPLAGGTPSQR